jgi:hypothetical protein
VVRGIRSQHQLTGNIGRVTPAGTITEFSFGLNSRPTGITADGPRVLWHHARVGRRCLFTEANTDKIGCLVR